MFTKLDVPQPVIRVIIYNQQYVNPLVLSHLTPKEVEQLVVTIHRLGGKKNEERDPRINVPLQIQEIITVACFALKDQWHWGVQPLMPLIISLSTVVDLCPEQEIKEVHNNNVAFSNCPKWDSTKELQVLI